MKKTLLYILAAVGTAGFTGCSKSDFTESYTDPSKIQVSTVDKQYAGFVYSYNRYNLPSYWNYFVILRTTLHHYTQSVGWENGDNQYVPGAASITDRWNDYYYTLAQFRELENIYNRLTEIEQKELRIYMLTATIFLYDQTQKTIDLHGDIPFSQAGKISANSSNYVGALASYDGATAIYTKMLDDLKAFADELNTITIRTELVSKFNSQDLLNNGNLTAWKRYANSLRLRMLTRVSGVASFQSRVNTEIAAIIADPAKYPVVTTNAENIRFNVYNLNTDINSKGFRTGLEDWNGNIAGKVMIDHMKTSADPRLRAMFEPGANAAGVYNGLDPLLNRSVQNSLIAGGTMAIYNRSTISRNEFFPGMMINAAEVSFLLAEYYLKGSNNTAAKAAYENGIKLSVEYYYGLRSLSADNTAGALTPTNATEINAYIGSMAVNWDNATTNADKLKLLARQKWIHYSVIQSNENWAELRRLDALSFSFETDNANAQKQPPMRWVYPGSEITYNAANYKAVQVNDNLGYKLFWDTQ